VDFDEIASLVSADTSLAARVLKLANSCAFCGRSQVDSLKKALTRLGLRLTRSAVLGFALASGLDETNLEEERLHEFWRHALTTSHSARLYSEAGRIGNPDTAFAAGLLQDIGRLVLECALPQEDREVQKESKDQPDTELHEIEKRVLGTTHMELGGALLKRWGLPREICEAVYYHHHPDPAAEADLDEEAVKMVGLLKLADITSRMFNKGDKNITRQRVIQLADSTLGLSEKGTSELLEEVGERVRETAAIFDVNAQEVPRYPSIQAKAARRMVDLATELEGELRRYRRKVKEREKEVEELEKRKAELDS
jgi:HD-like signal output (HDOD) protein